MGRLAQLKSDLESKKTSLKEFYA
ncbi:MAG: hypothetical protein JWQ35_1567, partial [Bacteriovoracaceae bacterium]|nr:hypothetical protein [Bacteriovoracaceae bacterium]